MLELYRYRLPFQRPFITGVGTFQHREGVLLRYHTSDIDIVSEASPLPGFSKESLQQAEDYLSSKQKEVASFFDQQFSIDDLTSWINTRSGYPSVDFGLSSLGLFIFSIRQQKPVHSILNLSSSTAINVNAVIGETDESSFLSQARTHIANGFKVLKCKVTIDPGHLPHSLKTLANEHPDVSFRLDANRSWPLHDVTELSSRFSNLPIEYIEEPCMVESIDQFDSVCTNCILPVAADESLTELGLRTVINHSKSTPYLIIKPTLHGNLMELFATLRSPHHLENRVIFTTALESAVGIRMIASAAAMTGSKSSAHGLNTGSLFRQNLTPEGAINNGTFQLQPNFKSWYSFQSINQSLLRPVW